jgi:nucleoside phosphorylase
MTFQPDLILHGGAAGAINPDLMPGDIVLGQHYKILCSEPILEARRSLLLSNKAIRYCQAGESVHVEQLDAPAELITMGLAAARAVEAKHPTWAAAGWPANTPRRSPRAIAGTLGSQDGWTKDLKELDFIRREFAVDSEDMESSYIAQIAAKYAVPFLAVRSISNNEYFYSLAKSEIFPAVAAAAARAAEVLARLSLNLGQTAA